jgi:hypothetical protein
MSIRTQPRTVYTTVPVREQRPTPKGTQPVSHARRYVEGLYDTAEIERLTNQIEWLRALCAERYEFKRLPYATQERVNAWWTKRLAKGSRFEGGANVRDIQESLHQQRISLEYTLSCRIQRSAR